MEFAIFNTGSGWEERFLLQTPVPAPTSPAPLVVVFHKYGSSHADLLNTGLIAEALARGWYVMCPLGARQRHFGNFESQINTRAALNLVRQLCPVDPQRVYGVGFSMGGGSVANYAARHIDPKGVMFAAICDHTGGVSLGHTYWSENDDNDADDNVPNPGDNLEPPDVLEDLFGGTPTTSPFKYQQCSSIDLDPFTGQIGAFNDFARNLSHIPVLVWRASADPTLFLVRQTDDFDFHVQPFNASNQYTQAPGTMHAWTTLNAQYLCDWFSTKTLTLPSAARTLADEDGNWLYFFVEQDAPGAFTPFTWNVNAAAKTITINATQNLKRLKITPAGFGLTLTGTVTLNLSTSDATGDRFQFLYVPNAPLSVTRDGVPASGTWDAQAHTYEVSESTGGLHTWVFTFP
jgi:pimeloyl-ACP methyl ester carboxylesterase